MCHDQCFGGPFTAQEDVLLKDLTEGLIKATSVQ